MIWKKHPKSTILSVFCEVSLLDYESHCFPDLGFEATQHILNKLHNCVDFGMKLTETSCLGANRDGSLPERAIFLENWYVTKEEDLIKFLLLGNDVPMQ